MVFYLFALHCSLTVLLLESRMVNETILQEQEFIRYASDFIRSKAPWPNVFLPSGECLPKPKCSFQSYRAGYEHDYCFRLHKWYGGLSPKSQAWAHNCITAEFLRLVYAIYPAQSFKLYLWFDLIDDLVNFSALFLFSGMFLCKSQKPGRRQGDWF